MLLPLVMGLRNGPGLSLDVVENKREGGAEGGDEMVECRYDWLGIIEIVSHHYNGTGTVNGTGGNLAGRLRVVGRDVQTTN
jgi:hypothetical protein